MKVCFQVIWPLIYFFVGRNYNMSSEFGYVYPLVMVAGAKTSRRFSVF